MPLSSLLDILAYKRQVLEQLLAVASIFGGFAVTGVVALRADTARGVVHAFAFGVMSLAAIAFIFATALDAIWIPMSQERLSSAAAVRALLGVGDSVAWAVITGATSLAAAVGLLGFARSRVMGFVVLGFAVVAVILFAANVAALLAAA